MARTQKFSRELARLADLHEKVPSAFETAARGLRPLLKRERTGGLALEATVLSRGEKGGVAHCPVRLKKPMRVAELFKRPNVVGVVVTTRTARERVTRSRLEPGAYAVRLRPIACDLFAFDLLRADGSCALAAPAELSHAPPPASTTLSRFYGIDIQIDPLDDIINPYHMYICLSFLWWRVCLDFPRPTFPGP